MRIRKILVNLCPRLCNNKVVRPKSKPWRLPWWFSGKEPAHQCRDTNSILDLWGYHTQQGDQAHVPQPRKPVWPMTCAPQRKEPPQWEEQARQPERSWNQRNAAQQRGPSTTIKKAILQKKSKPRWPDSRVNTLNHGDMLLQKFYSNFIEETWVFHLIFLNWARTLTLSHSSLQAGKSRDSSQH